MRNAIRSVWSEPRFPDAPGPYWRDWALVSVMVPLAVLEAVFREDVVWRPLALIFCVALAFTLPWRRTQPLAVVAVAFGATAAVDVVNLFAGREPFGLYTTAFILLVPYALARWGSGRQIVFGIAIAICTATLAVLGDSPRVAEAIGAYGILLFVVALGAAVRYSTTSQERQLDQVRFREREQLARDLHDTVAHHVSAIAVQAQAGRAVAASSPEAAAGVLEVIEEAASRTLIEMRAMVGALRYGEDAELGVRYGVRDVERLAEEFGDLPRVAVELAGDLEGLSPSLDTAIYRIAQESITNAVRHARDATRVDVQVAGENGSVRLVVADDGNGGAHSRSATGFGLVGMTERAELLGGTLQAGPRPDGGWTVTAVLPRAGTSG